MTETSGTRSAENDGPEWTGEQMDAYARASMGDPAETDTLTSTPRKWCTSCRLAATARVVGHLCNRLGQHEAPLCRCDRAGCMVPRTLAELRLPPGSPEPLQCNAMGILHDRHDWGFGSGEIFTCPGYAPGSPEPLQCNAMGILHDRHDWGFGSGEIFTCPGYAPEVSTAGGAS